MTETQRNIIQRERERERERERIYYPTVIILRVPSIKYQPSIGQSEIGTTYRMSILLSLIL